jgi:hypothetical protein
MVCPVKASDYVCNAAMYKMLLAALHTLKNWKQLKSPWAIDWGK